MNFQTALLIVLVVAAVVAVLVWAYRNNFLNGFFGKEQKPKVFTAANGFRLLAEGKRNKAMDELRDVVIHVGGTPEIYISLAVLYRKRGEPDKAIHICEGLLLRKVLPKDTVDVVLSELITEYRASQNISRAEECLTRIKSVADEDSVLLLRAFIAGRKGEHEEAVKIYTKYEKITKTSCAKEISYEYIQIKAYKSAIRVYPKNREAHFELAALCFEKGETAEGIALLTNVIRKDLGRTAEDNKRIQDAFYINSTINELITIMSEKVASDSTCPLPYLFLSKIYRKRGDADKAKEILKHYLTVHESKAVVVRAYAQLAEDSMLLRVARLEANYVCIHCDTKHTEFTNICTNCGNVYTLTYH